MMISSRQVKFGCANVPPINFSKKIDIKGYESVHKLLSRAVFDKMVENERWKDEEIVKKVKKKAKRRIITSQIIFTTSIAQTIHFLKHIDALKPIKPIKELKLWRELYDLTPFFEGINCQLKSMLIKHFYPKTAKQLEEGHCYASYNLDKISEAVLYTIEYFKKNDLLKTFEECNQKIITKWNDDYNKYLIEHKAEIEKKNKNIDKVRKENKKLFEKSMKDINNFKLKKGMIFK